MKKEKYVAYVGTYTHENSVGIHIYDVDEAQGTLTEKNVVPISNPSDLTVSKNGKYLYSITDDGIVSFRIQPDGNLEKINEHDIDGMRGCDIDIDDKDQYLFIAGYHDGKVTMMHLNEDGSVGAIADGIFHKGVGIGLNAHNSTPHVTCVKVTPDQKYLCAVDEGLNHIKIYEIDYEKGKLKLFDVLRCQLNAAPRSIRFSHDGKYAFVLCGSLNCVNMYRYEKENGSFELIQTTSTVYEQDPDNCMASGMEVSDSGKYLFCSNAGTNTVVIFEINKSSGMLEEFCHSKISGDYPKTLAIMPDDAHFVSLNHGANEIVPFKINYEEKYFLLHGRPIKIDKPNSIYIHRLRDNC